LTLRVNSIEEARVLAHARLNPAPIIKMLGVSATVVLSMILIDMVVKSRPNAEALMAAHPWLLADLLHIPQFVIPFFVIWHVSRGRLGTYGFSLRQDSHLTHRRVLLIGLAFGLAMSLRYIPEIVRTGGVDIRQPVTAVNVIGHLTFQWLVVGLSEETLFRGLIQTYLMKNLQGHVRLAGHDFLAGTVVGAFFWGAFHFMNLLIMPIGPVIFLVVLTTAIGLILGYAYQLTGSLLTTIIMHSTVVAVPVTVGYVLHWLL